jgi:hypothetical protein
MESGLLQEDFEDGVAVGDVHESVGAEHETQQAAAPAAVGDAGHAGLGEVGAAEDNAANPAAAEVHEEQIVVVVHGHNARPAHRPADGDRIRLAPLSVQALRMSASPARARDRTLMFRATKVI